MRFKRTFSLLVCAALAAALLPCAPACAASAAWDGTTIDVSWYNESDTEFYLSTPEQLMGLAAIVNGIYNTEITRVTGNASCIQDHTAGSGIDTGAGGNNLSTGTYHYGGDDFNGKTVYLTADLDMGGRQDAATGLWSGPNYMPIGGQYLMEKNNASTKLSSSFCGTLDGQGHTVYNIFCERHCSTGNYGDGQSVGLIGRLGVHDNDDVSLRPETAGVYNLAVTGYIRGNRSVGGIVGKIGKSVNGVTIENCANFASVNNTDAKGCGGIAGAGWNSGVIRNCYNAGAVSSTYTCPTGGISGSNEAVIENCYSVGTVTAAHDSYAMGIGTNNGGGTDVDNCYWLSGSAAGGGYYGANDGTVTELTAAGMKAEGFPARLGDAFTADTAGINGGYPILKWQAEAAAAQKPPAQSSGWSDVAADAWYAPAVAYVMEAGLFDLTGADAFSPDAPMTRLMLAEALYRLSGSPSAEGESPFPDCSAPAAIWAYEQGVAAGMGDGSFAPGASITREQIAAMLMRYASLPGDAAAQGDLSAFPDRAAVSAWAEEAMAWAVGEGLINGTGAGALEPQGTATRAQVAQILLNMAG